MGRYITHISNLKLINEKGEVIYNFGLEGELIIGDPTSFTGAANKIDPDKIVKIYETDLLGGTTQIIEIKGQGSLNKKNDAGADLPKLETGYRGKFFKAPPITPGSNTVAAIQGIRYKVLKGTVTYKSVTYKQNDVFVSDGTTTATSGTGRFALYLPKFLTDECCDDSTEHFKIKKLMHGDESTAYWFPDEGGFVPRASLTTTDANFYGWVRKE